MLLAHCKKHCLFSAVLITQCLKDSVSSTMLFTQCYQYRALTHCQSVNSTVILAYCFQHSANIVLADLRVYSQKISTAKEKIAQIYLHVFPSLPMDVVYITMHSLIITRKGLILTLSILIDLWGCIRKYIPRDGLLMREWP